MGKNERTVAADAWRLLGHAVETQQKERRDVSQRELASLPGFSASKVSRLLDVLEANKWVTRARSGNMNLVRVTLVGQSMWVARMAAPPTESQPAFLKDRLHRVLFSVPHVAQPAPDALVRVGFVLVEGFRNSQKWTGVREAGVDIQITSRNVLLHIEEIVADNPYEALQQAKNKAVQALDLLRRKVPALRLKPDYTLVPADDGTTRLVREASAFLELRDQQHALVGDPVSRFHHERGARVEVRDDTGALRLISDRSHGRDELEAVHRVKSADDITAVARDLLKPAIEGAYQGLPEVPHQVRSLEEQKREIYEVLLLQAQVADRKTLLSIISEQRAQLTQYASNQERMQKEIDQLRAMMEQLRHMKERAFTGERSIDVA